MAADPTPQQLREFVESLIDDVGSGRISPEEAMVASGQYPFLRQLLNDRGGDISRALGDKDKLRALLGEVFQSSLGTIDRQLPQLQTEKPDQALSPGDIVARATSLRSASTSVATAITSRRRVVEATKKNFIARLVQNWIEQTRAKISEEEKNNLAQDLGNRISQEASEDAPAGELAGRIRQALATTRLPGEAIDRVVREATPLNQELSGGIQKLTNLRALPKELINHLDIAHPDWFAKAAIQAVETGATSVSDAVYRSLRVTQAAEAIEKGVPTATRAAASGVFFQALAGNGAQKAFAAVADGLMKQLSPLGRQDVMRAAFSRALEGVLAKTDVLTGRLGQEFVESELFRILVEHTRKTISLETGPAAGVQKARGAIDDILGSILRGPVVVALTGNPQEAILTYLELFAVNSRLARDQKMILTEHGPVLDALRAIKQSTAAAQPQETIAGLSLAAANQLQQGAAALSRVLPSWEILYTILLGYPSASSLFTGAALAGGGVGGTTIGADASGAFMGTLGGALNSALGFVGGGLSSVATGLFGGLVGSLFGGSLGSIFGGLLGPRQKTRLVDDMPKLLALVIIIAIIVLFVFPSFFNSSFVRNMTEYAAMFVRSEEQPDRFTDSNEEFPPPDYIDFSGLDSKEFNCLAFGQGINTSYGQSQSLNPSQQAKITSTINDYPQLKLLSCSLGCPANQVNITAFSRDGVYAGFAPSAHPGNIVFYPRAFGFRPPGFARLLAHELAHNIDWLSPGVEGGFAALGCGKTGTYPWDETPAETFAEAVSLYMIGDPLIKTYCGGKALEYFNGVFNQCR